MWGKKMSGALITHHYLTYFTFIVKLFEELAAFYLFHEELWIDEARPEGRQDLYDTSFSIFPVKFDPLHCKTKWKMFHFLIDFHIQIVYLIFELL